MTVPWTIAQVIRGSLPLAFPALWLLGPTPLIGASLAVALVAYLTGRASVARAGHASLPLATSFTPFGESLLVAGALALASVAVATRSLLPLGLVTGGSVAGGALVVHGVVLARAGRAERPLSARAKRVAALCGLVGEVALSIALLTIAAQAHIATLAGPIGATQLITSPWPALLGLAVAFVPLIRLSLVEGETTNAPRRALEAATVTATGLILVGLGGPAWWP
jgi:hypothetical protein